MAVNNSIIDIAILPDKAKSYSLFMILITSKDIRKLDKSIINGFIFLKLLKYKSQKRVCMKNWLWLNNTFSYSFHFLTKVNL